jgi:hypothetical protein
MPMISASNKRRPAFIGGVAEVLEPYIRRHRAFIDMRSTARSVIIGGLFYLVRETVVS